MALLRPNTTRPPLEVPHAQEVATRPFLALALAGSFRKPIVSGTGVSEQAIMLGRRRQRQPANPCR
jgi:hypothetical protein